MQNFEEKVLKSVNKIPTSTNTISKKCKLSHHSVQKILDRLSDKGLIVRNDFYRVSNKKGSIVWYKN